MSAVRWGGHTPPSDEQQPSEQAETRVTSGYFDLQSVMRVPNQQQQVTTTTTTINTELAPEEDFKTTGEEETKSASTATMSGQEEVEQEEGGEERGFAQELEDFSNRGQPTGSRRGSGDSNDSNADRSTHDGQDQQQG